MFLICRCNEHLTVDELYISKCPKCGKYVPLASLCFAFRAEKHITFPECDICTHRFRCFTDRDLSNCEWITCKQVILNGGDYDEVWCLKKSKPCSESPELCKVRYDDNYEPQF
jgi:hypothetical protein